MRTRLFVSAFLFTTACVGEPLDDVDSVQRGTSALPASHIHCEHFRGSDQLCAEVATEVKDRYAAFHEAALAGDVETVNAIRIPSAMVTGTDGTFHRDLASFFPEYAAFAGIHDLSAATLTRISSELDDHYIPLTRHLVQTTGLGSSDITENGATHTVFSVTSHLWKRNSEGDWVMIFGQIAYPAPAGAPFRSGAQGYFGWGAP